MKAEAKKLAPFIKSILKRTTEFFRNVEKKKLILLVSLAIVVVVGGIVGAVLLNQVKYTVLYSGLDASEAGTIKTVLDEKGVIAKVEGTGTILVPEEKADELRMTLAAEGYPNTGLNYEIFASSSSIGATDLERRTYLQYQLQENIRSTIRVMDKVQDSMVIVNLASNSSFVVSDNQTEASVAVMLKLKGGEELTASEARTIGQFIKSCVPELKPENISIVDSKMKYYDIQNESGENTAEYSASQQQLTQQMKDTLSEQALRVIEPAMGEGNVAISVNLSLDFDKETVSSVEFSPPVEGETEGLIRSSEELYNATGSQAEANGSAGTDTNGSGTPAYVTEDGSVDTDISTSKTYNYELNEIQTQIEKAQLSVQDLSVAVLVNSKVEGADTYVSTVKNLVAKAIGVKADYISVEMLPFVDNTSIEDAFAESQKTAQQESTNKLITTLVTIVLIFAAVIIVIKLIIGRTSRRPEEQGTVAAGSYVVGVTAGEAGMPPVEMYDLSDLILKRSTEAEKIEELMDRYPETVAQILRTWIAEDN